MVTRAGWWVVASSLVAIVAGRVFALDELPVLGAIGIALVVVAVVWVRARPIDVQVTRHLRPARVPVGGRCRVELTVVNSSSRRSPVLELHDPVEGTVGASIALAPLDAEASASAGYRMPTDARGLVHAGPLEVGRSDPFGLARRTVLLADQACVTVLPTIHLLRGHIGGSGLDDPLAGLARPGLGVAGIENFAALRPYVVGDDLRRVHWASSARTGDLVVREDDPPWRGHLTLVLDAREDHIDPERFELAVSAAASILHAVTRRGDRGRLLITDGTDTGADRDHPGSDTLLDQLAVVDRHPGGALPDPPVDGRIRTGGLVLVTGSPAAPDLVRFTAHRDRYGWARVVLIDPSAVGGEPDPPRALPGRAIDVVRVDADTPFPVAWAEADRSPVGR